MSAVRKTEIREARPEEFAALAAVTVAAYKTLDGPVPPEYEKLLADVGTRAATCTVFVAIADREVVGGVTYVADPGSPYAEFDDPAEACFRMLAVAPAGRAGGVGEALVQACIAEARVDGKARLTLFTTPWMPAAHRLYSRLGFTRTPERDWSPEPDVSLLGYVKDL